MKNLLRASLLFSFFYNIFGSLAFAFPQTFGGAAGLPPPAAFLYSKFVACNILLFAFISLWLSRHSAQAIPLLVVFGVSKIIFCALMVTSYGLGEVHLIGVMMSGVDLILGLIFILGARHLSRHAAARSV